MGLNDQREKLRQAEEWLTTEPENSLRYRAAFEHLRWVTGETTDSSLCAQAWDIAARVFQVYPSSSNIGTIDSDRVPEMTGLRVAEDSGKRFDGEYIPPPPPESGRFVIRRNDGLAPLVFSADELADLVEEGLRLLTDTDYRRN